MNGNRLISYQVYWNLLAESFELFDLDQAVCAHENAFSCAAALARHESYIELHAELGSNRGAQKLSIFWIRVREDDLIERKLLASLDRNMKLLRVPQIVRAFQLPETVAKRIMEILLPGCAWIIDQRESPA